MQLNSQSIASKLIPSDKFIANKSDWRGHAAVLLPLLETELGLSLLLTKRAEALNTHGGEVAFPGGMWEAADSFPVDTALRESEEEVDLKPQNVEVLGLLPTHPTRRQVMVEPVVGLLRETPVLKPNPDEIDSVFWVPLGFFMEDRRERTDIFNHKDVRLWAPAYRFENYEIWGFTAGVIKTFMNTCFGAKLEREHSAPEKHWEPSGWI